MAGTLVWRRLLALFVTLLRTDDADKDKLRPNPTKLCVGICVWSRGSGDSGCCCCCSCSTLSKEAESPQSRLLLEEEGRGGVASGLPATLLEEDEL
jgi:hypothetical protein